MDDDHIREALETATGVPSEALAAAVARPEAIEEKVIEVLEKAARGVFLLPRQDKLLFYGLHALAVAGRTKAFSPLVALLRRPEPELDRRFGDALTANLTGLVLGLFDGDIDPVFAALEAPEVEGYVKWAMFKLLARLSFDGRVARERVVALLDRFAREKLAPEGDAAWEGWASAIILLGLTEFEARLRDSWASDRATDFINVKVESEDEIRRLHDAAARPDDLPRFVTEDAEPLRDPAQALAWMRGTNEKVEQAETDDPAADVKLSNEEIFWLRGFLTSAQACADTMDFEQLDGFLTCIATAPEEIPAPEWLAHAFDSERQTDEPSFDSDEQRGFVEALMTRHLDAIRKRLEAGYAHQPEIEKPYPEEFRDPDEAEQGQLWAVGFLKGTLLRSEAWEPLLRDPEGEFLPALQALLAGVEDADYGVDPRVLRTSILEALPAIITRVHRYWRHGEPFRLPARRSQRQANIPMRSTKVGRNQPCPCGSGRKYKKCCGASPAPFLQ